jgi:hypothetical protein
MTLDPGLDRHEWETEFAQIEEDLHEAPAEALPELSGLVERMLVERGFELQPESLDETGLVPEFLAAKEVAAQAEDADPGDVADAIEKLLPIYRYLDEERRAP